MEIGGGQGDSGKGVLAAGLYGNAHLIPKLVVDGGDLGSGGRDGHGCLRVSVQDLAVYPLDHGFILPVFCLKDLDKLFGADVVGERPQPLSRTA